MPSPKIDSSRYLRNHMSDAERKVWSRLRGRQVSGYKFRRQVPVGPYYADFMCKAARLIVEVDGEGHDEERDRRKTVALEALGYRVVRIPVQDIDECFDDVILGIYLQLVA